MVRELKLDPVLSDKQASGLASKLLKEDSFNLLINYDADVYCAETGKPVAKFRKNLIPASIAKKAYENLRGAASPTRNRGVSSSDHKLKLMKKDGTISGTNQTKQPSLSGVIGYFDRTPRTPYCRQTAFTQLQFEKFKNSYGIIKFVDSIYEKLMPDHYARQKAAADETEQDFVIRGTSFTTVTVNKNWQTAVHKDQGDFKEGFGNLVALRKGRYTGGYFVVPKWGVAFDLQNCDVLLVDVHQWHGNTPIYKIDEDAERVSLVMYYREKMIYCGSAEEEAEKVKRRPVRGSTPLN